MNRDEGSYQLSHAYYRFLGTTTSPRVKNRMNQYLFRLLVKVFDRDGIAHKSKNWLYFDDLLIRNVYQPNEYIYWEKKWFVEKPRGSCFHIGSADES